MPNTSTFNLSAKETRIAKASRSARVPTLEQIYHVIRSMPSTTEIEKRDRALIAFTILTGARDGAIRSFKLRHIDIVAGTIDQDEGHIKDLQTATRSFGLQLKVLKVREVADFETTFATLVQQRVGAVLVTSDALFDSHRGRVVDLAARNAIPTMYPWRDFVDAGGLLSYGNSLNDALRHVGLYAGRILKGDKASDLPVWVPTKFEFVMNLKTAKALGLEIPAKVLAFADEVIE
jgi:hypothetical protein